MKIFLSLLYRIGTMSLLFLSTTIYAQELKKLDSLKMELVKFETHKNKMGQNVSKQTDTTKVKIIHKIIIELFKINPLDALPYTKQELALSEEIDYKWGISQAQNTLGAIYDYRGDYKNAIIYYKKALKGKIDIKDEYGQVDIYLNMGVLYSRQFDYTEALSNLLKGLEIAKKLKDNFGILGAYNNIGVLYKSQQQYDKAVKNYLSCLKLQHQLNDTYFIAITYQNIGEAYFDLKQYEKASPYFEKGIKIAHASDNLQTEASNYDGIGKIYLHKKDYGKANNCFAIALQLREKIQDVLGIAYSYMHLADVYFAKNDDQQALSYSNKSIESLQQFGDLAALSHGYDLRSKIHQRNGNFQLAYQNHVLYKSLNDSIFNLERDKKLNEMQLRFTTKSIRDSLQSIQDKKDIMDREEARVQKNATNYIYLVLTVILIFLMVLLVQRNKLETIKRQKALEQERNRISRNLHDDLGAQLSAVRMFISSIKNQPDKNKIEETVKNSLGLLDASIYELRNIMNDIHSSLLQEQGYLHATEVLVNKINQLHMMQFSLSHHNIDKRFHPEIEHELYRITQELVNNTLKYARAESVYIELIKRHGKLIFMYEDDGQGYDASKIKKGNGLSNIESRVKMLNGIVSFDSATGTGSSTIIEIPL